MPFENVLCQGHIQNFFQNFSTHHFSSLFQARFFSAELILSNLSAKNDPRGVRGHAPRKFFENLHTVMVILVLFGQF